MLEPKKFYRKLDALLSTIRQKDSVKDELYNIAKEIEYTFGEDLSVANGRVYEEGEDGNFTLVSPLAEQTTDDGLSGDSEAVLRLLESRSYIYDDPKFNIEGYHPTDSGYSIPAALTVYSPEARWILMFDLRAGWIREEIQFCLNAVRSAINYRLFSQAVNSEMQQAAHIQQSLLPSTSPQLEGYQVAGFSKPAELVGGDVYDYYHFNGEGFGVCIGDASGHGLPAALLVRDVVIGLRMGLEKHMKMVHTIKKLNKVLFRGGLTSKFISLFYAEFEENGNIFYVNAGHPAPILFKKDGTTATLESTGLILGAFPEIELHRGYSSMQSGEVLMLYTDGIFERHNYKRQEFGLQRMEEIVFENMDAPPKEINNKIFTAANEFGNKRAWEDDVTLVCLKKE